MLKMESQYQMGNSNPDYTVEYTLPVGKTSVHLNPLIGRQLNFRYSNEIYCIHCGALIWNIERMSWIWISAAE
jgi:hypothetical protein